MNFTVIYHPKAESRLAHWWVTAEDKEAIAHAADAMDSALQRDPLSVGESRETEMDRVALHYPLGFQYEVLIDDRKVLVLDVWRYGRPGA